ncbi:hypothetical protein [Bradyrhizobium sp. Leo121]|uniref:hypothetical protein n=1 Tax=Bradyrhizobium sp. Leo121 TaxID=1571195 RepID=UPI0010295515|nr:hypothetical protein [Bradyrhizobium sp. Leo121]RZN19503.1 hypothetical protein CWO90_35320 [Bradyrhizobium sp. Leo121]
MIGRFIIECDPDYFEDAVHAARELFYSDNREGLITAKYGDRKEVHMFAKRLKKSIRVQQVKP